MAKSAPQKNMNEYKEIADKELKLREEFQKKEIEVQNAYIASQKIMAERFTIELRNSRLQEELLQIEIENAGLLNAKLKLEIAKLQG